MTAPNGAVLALGEAAQAVEVAEQLVGAVDEVDDHDPDGDLGRGEPATSGRIVGSNRPLTPKPGSVLASPPNTLEARP